MREKVYVGLVHYPVYNKNNDIVATSVTNFDIHDISRTCRTYDIENYFIITPLDAQKELTGRIIGFWQEGCGIEFNKNRNEAFEHTRLMDSIEDCNKKNHRKRRERTENNNNICKNLSQFSILQGIKQ